MSLFTVCQFRFADSLDIFLMVVGTIMAIANGAVLPAMVIVFGEMTNSFVENSILEGLPPHMTLPESESKINFYMSIYFPYSIIDLCNFVTWEQI